MENSFGSGGLFHGSGGNSEPAKIQASGEKSPKFKWEWRLFAAYGCVWIAIFFGLVCVQKAVGIKEEMSPLKQVHLTFLESVCCYPGDSGDADKQDR